MSSFGMAVLSCRYSTGQKKPSSLHAVALSSAGRAAVAGFAGDASDGADDVVGVVDQQLAGLQGGDVGVVGYRVAGFGLLGSHR